MSGGSWDYAYSKVRHAADDLRYGSERRHYAEDSPQPAPDSLRVQFADTLDVVADAMRAIEWSDSGDFGPDDWREPVQAIVDACAPLVAKSGKAQDD